MEMMPPPETNDAPTRNATMKANEFLGLLFLARDVAHSVHLNTRSFSKHEALNIFYNRIIGAADDFAEAYQGRLRSDWPYHPAFG
jgi:hypothetical protein